MLSFYPKCTKKEKRNWTFALSNGEKIKEVSILTFQTTMTISILMPVFNAGAYLAECLNSIIQQTESDWELLAVDDFSTDNSCKILNDFAEKDQRIRILQNTEKGIIPALKLAFQNSSGGLITRMDADDRMSLDKLAVLKSILIKNGVGHLATGCVQYFSANELGGGYLKYEQWLNDLTKNSDNFSEIYKECVIPSPCWMVFRDDLVRCGAFDAKTYPEDYDLCFRFYKNELKVVGSEAVLHHWRDYDTRSSRTMEVYSNNNYFNLKLPYFLELERVENRPLVLWGAGKKGKQLARMLEDRGVFYHWFCNNPRKWGVQLFGATMDDFEKITDLENPQIIIAVASPEGKDEILVYLKKIGLSAGHYYFFT